MKFTVELFTANEPTDSAPATLYCVQVYNAEGEGIGDTEKFDTLFEAEKCLERNVKNYSLIVKAESVPVDDIWVYADKIQYRKIDPDCCFNCEFSETKDERRNCHGKRLICRNPENFKFFNDAIDGDPCRKCTRDNHGCNHNWWIHGELCDRGLDRRGSGWELGAPPCDCSDFVSPPHGCPGPRMEPFMFRLDARPKVDPNGICKNYKRRKFSPGRDCQRRPTA